MDNGIVQVTLSKPDGIVTGIQYNGIDNVLEVQNEEEIRGYIFYILLKIYCYNALFIRMHDQDDYNFIIKSATWNTIVVCLIRKNSISRTNSIDSLLFILEKVLLSFKQINFQVLGPCLE